MLPTLALDRGEVQMDRHVSDARRDLLEVIQVHVNLQRVGLILVAKSGSRASHLARCSRPARAPSENGVLDHKHVRIEPPHAAASSRVNSNLYGVLMPLMPSWKWGLSHSEKSRENEGSAISECRGENALAKKSRTASMTA